MSNLDGGFRKVSHKARHGTKKKGQHGGHRHPTYDPNRAARRRRLDDLRAADLEKEMNE